jgi:hypothetical protein
MHIVEEHAASVRMELSESLFQQRAVSVHELFLSNFTFVVVARGCHAIDAPSTSREVHASAAPKREVGAFSNTTLKVHDVYEERRG